MDVTFSIIATVYNWANMCFRDMFNLLESGPGEKFGSNQSSLQPGWVDYAKTITVLNPLRHHLSHCYGNIIYPTIYMKRVTATIQLEFHELMLQQFLSRPLFFIPDQCQFSRSRLYSCGIQIHGSQIKACSKAKYLLWFWRN